MICSLILIDPHRLRLPMSERSRYENMVTRSSWGSLCSPGGGGEEAKLDPGLGLGLGETNDIDRVSIF